jgi:hypothetical protein
MIARTDSETLRKVTEVMLDHGLIPMCDADLSNDGVWNVLIGIAPPSGFGYVLTLVLEDTDGAA